MTTLPTPVDFDRVRALLTDHCWSHDVLSLNTWSVTTQDVVYTWTVKNGEILRLTGRWRGVAADAESLRLLQNAILRCNCERVAPKAYLVPLKEEGHYSLAAEVAVLLDSGLTEEQFYGFCENSYTAVMGFLMEVEMRFPNLVTWKESA